MKDLEWITYTQTNVYSQLQLTIDVFVSNSTVWLVLVFILQKIKTFPVKVIKIIIYSFKKVNKFVIYY